MRLRLASKIDKAKSSARGPFLVCSEQHPLQLRTISIMAKEHSYMLLAAECSKQGKNKRKNAQDAGGEAGNNSEGNEGQGQEGETGDGDGNHNEPQPKAKAKAKGKAKAKAGNKRTKK